MGVAPLKITGARKAPKAWERKVSQIYFVTGRRIPGRKAASFKRKERTCQSDVGLGIMRSVQHAQKQYTNLCKNALFGAVMEAAFCEPRIPGVKTMKL